VAYVRHVVVIVVITVYLECAEYTDYDGVNCWRFFRLTITAFDVPNELLIFFSQNLRQLRQSNYVSLFSTVPSQSYEQI